MLWKKKKYMKSMWKMMIENKRTKKKNIIKKQTNHLKTRFYQETEHDFKSVAFFFILPFFDVIVALKRLI